MYKTRKRNGKPKNRGWMRNSQDVLIEQNQKIIAEQQVANSLKMRDLYLRERELAVKEETLRMARRANEGEVA